MSFGVSGKYRLDRRLGGGGMAEVFVGSTRGAEGFSRKIAIKRVLPGFSDNPGFAQQFVAEAQISSQLVHPNIVSVLDFDRDADGRLFLVMELVDGKDLDALNSSGMLPMPVVIFVIAEVLRGLGFAHDLPAGTEMRGIVHRDVSPHNVLLSWEGAVKVSDFGIAKARAASEATASVFIKGKPAYMSPEQANGERLDGRSDLFAVGIMLWEMLVGQRLFVAEDTRATLAAVLFGQIPRPRTLQPDVPKDLERVTMKLLERDLPVRYATAEEAIADLMGCADAPRGGRELLMAVLAERFPDSAPVRQSIARARALGASPTPLPGSLPAYNRLAVTETASAAVAPLAPPQPGLGTVMSASTGTLGVPQRRWLAQVLIVLAVTIASGVVAFVIVSAVKHKPATPAHGDAEPGTLIQESAKSSLRTPRAAAPGNRRTKRAPGHGLPHGNPTQPRRNLVQSLRNRRTLDAEESFDLHPLRGRPRRMAAVDGRASGDTPITLNMEERRVRIHDVVTPSTKPRPI
jgi:Protein kinase domain